MTAREAIEVIKSECYVFNLLNFDRSTMVNTALDMAVKALKQEPCDETVSRQAVLDVMKRELFMSDAISKIENLPSVKPQPKMGRWITRPHVYGVTYCSECDFELKIDDTNYCPKCGAKMCNAESDL